MSIRVMTRVWDQSTQKSGALLVLLALADIANDDGVAWPSVRTLAQRARMKERNVQYQLRKLEDEGEIKCSIGAGPGGSNLYTVLQKGVQPIALPPSSGVQSSAGATVQPSAPGGAISQHKGVQPITHKPSVEPSINRHGGEAPPQPTKKKEIPQPAPKDDCDPRIQHPAIRAYFDACQKADHARPVINVVQCELLIDAIGETPEALQRWQATLHDWLASGWRITNIPGLLDKFAKQPAATAPKDTLEELNKRVAELEKTYHEARERKDDVAAVDLYRRYMHWRVKRDAVKYATPKYAAA